MECSPLFYVALRSCAAPHESNNMTKQIKYFFKDEDGAVTVDWVVLTAAVVGLAIAAFASIQQGSQSVGNNVGTYLTDTPVEDLMGLGS